MRKLLLPQTIEGVCRQKRRFMFLLQTEPDKKLYRQAVNHCDRLTARIVERKKRRFRVFALLLCLSLFGGGCISNTVKGFGAMVQGTGLDIQQSVESHQRAQRTTRRGR